mgnify:CR=1 FL=1
MKEKPFLLLSNDDGFAAKGIQELIKVLRPMADLMVVAPSGPRSGASGSITSEHPLRCKKIESAPGFSLYSCTGTPVDCVKLALHDLVPRTPDMVIGGINHGDNSSVNVHYSGTMGVVIEGCLKKIPSVGFSLCNHAEDADFTPTFPYIQRIVEEVLQHGLPVGTCLNVNIPDVKDLKGVRICRQTDGVWTNEFVKSVHGYVGFTPTQIDVTAYTLMEQLNHWNWQL